MDFGHLAVNVPQFQHYIKQCFHLIKDVTCRNKTATVCIISTLTVGYVYIKCRGSPQHAIGYILKERLRDDQPYQGYEHAAVAHKIFPVLQNWFPLWFLRMILKSPFRSMLLRGIIRKSQVALTNCILPEAPTFKPVIVADKSFFDKHSVTDSELWDFIDSDEDKTNQFNFTSISALLNGYRQKNYTPTDVVERIIFILKEMDSQSLQLRTIIEYNEESMTKAASDSTERWNNGKPLSVFDGIPVAFKDQYFVDGYHCRNGTSFSLYDDVKSLNDENGMIKKLREGGAVFIGVANLHQCGIGVFGINPSKHHGTTLNPYNTQHSSGGSSSGSAAAVAAGLCPVALGSDAGGSIRLPAAACGVVGLKATYDRFSKDGLFVNSSTLGHAGPICSSVRDAAIAYGFLACKDSKDISLPPPVVLNKFDSEKVKKLKIGVDWLWINSAEEEIKEMCFKALKLIEGELDVEIVDIHFPEKEELYEAFRTTSSSEFASNNEMLHRLYENELNVDTLLAMAFGKTFLIDNYLQAAKQKTRSINALKYLFTQVDVLLTPGISAFQPKVNSAINTYGYVNIPLLADLLKCHCICNMTGAPALTLPIGYATNDLPVSLQIIAPWWREDFLLNVALEFEKLFSKRKPGCYYDITSDNVP